MTPVMEIMRRAGILPENLRHQQPDMFNCIKTAIAIAQTEAIKEAAEVATTKTEIEFSDDTGTYDVQVVDPQSILQLLNQIK